MIVNDKLVTREAVYRMEIGTRAWRIRTKDRAGQWADVTGEPHASVELGQQAAAALLHGPVIGVELQEVIWVETLNGPGWRLASTMDQAGAYPTNDEG